MNTLKKLTTLAAIGIVAWAGCSKDSGSSPMPGASQGSEATPPENMPSNGAMAAMSDGQILQILANVDSGEIEQAQTALSKAKSPAVREFAQHMVDQHTKAMQDGQQFSTQAKITPAPSEHAADMQKKGLKALEQLKSADAASFDATYMKGQVQQHQDVLNALNEKLIPAASSAELRNMLEKTKTMVQQHIDMAKKIEV